MVVYFWQEQAFLTDLKFELAHHKIEKIDITCGEISMRGAQTLVDMLFKSGNLYIPITIYCSTYFDPAPYNVLQYIQSYAKVKIVQATNFMANVLVIHTKTLRISYTGSTLFSNKSSREKFELVHKAMTNELPIPKFWKMMEQNSAIVNEDILDLYARYDSYEREGKMYIFMNELTAIFTRQQQISDAEKNLAYYYFTRIDFGLFEEQFHDVQTEAIEKQREIIHTKLQHIKQQLAQITASLQLIPLHESIQFKKDAATFYFGKHSQQFQKNIDGQYAAITFKLHKHGVEFSFNHGQAGISLDRQYVTQNWQVVKQSLKDIFPSITGFNLVWRFLSEQTEEIIAQVEIDKVSPQAFLAFLRGYDEEHYLSECVAFYAMDHPALYTLESITEEGRKMMLVLSLLYEVLTKRSFLLEDRE